VGDGKFGFPFGPRVGLRYADVGGLVPQGISAELIADKWGLSREDLDGFAAESQARAARATAEGRFENEIIAVRSIHRDKESGDITESDELVTADEGIREGTTVETLANLKPAFKPDGKVTAGNSSQITDGASAVLIMSEDKARELGLRPRARFHTFALAGVDPVMMLTGPIPSTAKVLEKSGLSIGDIDLFEVNEAFASVVLAWEKETGADMSKVNVNGGAIALGHPVGMSGTRIALTLMLELSRRGGGLGAAALCGGGGQGDALLVSV
jgi:acetyl-CoA acyltransferase